MYINVYKGFDIKYLNGVHDAPLINDSIENRINVVDFNVKTKKALETALLSLDDGEIRWITYEEYSLIRDRIDMAINDYGLKVKIYINNLLPEVYPINFEINDNLYEEINKHIGKVLKETNGFDNEESVVNALKQVISAKHADMLEVNLNAMRLGRDY